MTSPLLNIGSNYQIQNHPLDSGLISDLSVLWSVQATLFQYDQVFTIYNFRLVVAKLRTGITKAVQSVSAVATRSMSLIFDARRAFRRFTFFVKNCPQTVITVIPYTTVKTVRMHNNLKPRVL